MTLFVLEPPMEYVSRPPAVVDSSVLAAFVFGEPEAELAEARMHPYALHAPALLPFEIANVAASKLRRRIAPVEALAERLTGFDFDTITLASIPAAGMLSLAQRYALSAYDAAYLWLAVALKAPLITFDGQLATAAAECLAGLPPQDPAN